jgi:hypothetical protein
LQVASFVKSLEISIGLRWAFQKIWWTSQAHQVRPMSRKSDAMPSDVHQMFEATLQALLEVYRNPARLVGAKTNLRPQGSDPRSQLLQPQRFLFFRTRSF